MPPYVLAVDLGSTQIRAALCDPQGQIVRRIAHPTQSSEDPDKVIKRVIDTLGVPADQVAGIGIGVPGLLNPTNGVVLEAPGLAGWSNVPLRAMISERFSWPVFLGNDANLAGLAECLYGAGRGVRDLIYLAIGSGIGGGIIADGQMLLGAEGLAAEVGHMIIVPDGPLCSCGGHGCLESLASGPAIARDVVARIKAGKKSRMTKAVDGNLDKIDVKVVSLAAQHGDKLAINAFRRAGEYLGLGIATLLRLFNPRMVVLGGSVARAGSFLFDPMRATIQANALPRYRKGLVIMQAALGEDAGLLGAAALAITELDKRQSNWSLPADDQRPPTD